MAKKKVVRLTTEMRTKIINNALVDIFNEKVADITARKNKLALEILECEIGEANLKHVNELPKEYFAATQSFSVRMAMPDGTKYGRIYFENPARAPAYLQYGNGAAELTHTNPKHVALWEEYLAIVKAAEEESEQREEVRAGIFALIKGVSTTDALIEAWPEGKQYIPIADDAEKSLPAVNVGNLNALIARVSKK